MWMVRASFIVLLSLLGLGAHLSWPRVLEAASAGQDALHEVLPGDNLHLIAGYYYGDARQWERIWQANRGKIRNPNLIERGSLLHIPDAVPPDESYTDFLSRARRAVTAARGPAESEVSRPTETQAPASGGAGPASAGPERESSTPPGPGAPTGAPTKQP